MPICGQIDDRHKEEMTMELVDCPVCFGRTIIETFHGPDDEMALEYCPVCDGTGLIPSDLADLVALEDEGNIDARVAAYWERAA